MATSTAGVLPVPPTVRLPMETTGTGRARDFRSDAAAHPRGAAAEGRERGHGDLDRRGLARAADREVADGAHWNGESARLQDAPRLHPLPPPHHSAPSP